MDNILDFMTTYEKYSIYLNFIDEEGHKAYIKSKYDILFPKLNKDELYNNAYKSIEDLRKYLLENKKFSYFDNTQKKEMDIFLNSEKNIIY